MCESVSQPTTATRRCFMRFVSPLALLLLAGCGSKYDYSAIIDLTGVNDTSCQSVVYINTYGTKNASCDVWSSTDALTIYSINGQLTVNGPPVANQTIYMACFGPAVPSPDAEVFTMSTTQCSEESGADSCYILQWNAGYNCGDTGDPPQDTGGETGYTW